MTKLYLHDKSWPLQALDTETLAGLEVSYIISVVIDLCNRENTLEDATHAIVHVRPEVYEQYETEDFNLNVDSQILLIVSTRGLSRNHIKKERRNKTRYVLYSRDTSELKNSDVLRAFCRMSVDEAEAVYTQNTPKVPGPLLRLFGLFSMDSFFALNILCQGYILLHPHLVEQLYPELKDSVINSLIGNYGPPKKLDNPTTVRGEKINAAPMEDRHWWKDVLKEECMLEMMKTEYENMKLPWDDNSSVAGLCKWIDGENIDENLELTVAKAYLEILKILGK